MTVELLEDELQRHRDQSATAQWAIELLASRRFKRYLRILKSGQIRIDRAAIREVEKYDGKWVIETNDDTISLEDAACGYKGLMVIERCFRSLKRTQIRMTPDVSLGQPAYRSARENLRTVLADRAYRREAMRPAMASDPTCVGAPFRSQNFLI